MTLTRSAIVLAALVVCGCVESKLAATPSNVGGEDVNPGGSLADSGDVEDGQASPDGADDSDAVATVDSETLDGETIDLASRLVDVDAIPDVADALALDAVTDSDSVYGGTDAAAADPMLDVGVADEVGQPDAVDTGDALADAATIADAADVAAADAPPLPTAGPAGPNCKDKRYKGDGKIPLDNCWAPPQHYCSLGEGAMFWFGCSPDASVCCLADAFCHPCGWRDCPMIGKGDTPPTPTAKCPKYFDFGKFQDQPPECKPYLSNETPICWDNAPAQWKTKAFHYHDGDLAP